MDLETSHCLREETDVAEKSSTSSNMSKKSIFKNLITIGLAFLFLFSAFSSTTVLQSTINKDGGLGTSGLATLYCALIVSCMFLPSFLVSHLGCKWTIALSMICYIVYMAANMHAAPYTIYPASIIIGLGAAPLWSAKCTYLTEIAVRYAAMTGQTVDVTINFFFGIFFMLFQSAGIWGNVISSTVLKMKQQNISDEQLTTCGPNFCPSSQYNNTNLERPSDTKIYTLIGVYFASAVLAFLIIVFVLDKITLKNENNKRAGKGKLSLHLLGDTFNHCWKSKYQKLLIPITLYSGMEQAFFGGDFTKAYIGCSAGVWNVGYVIISCGVVTSICSVTFGKLVQYVGHVVFFVIGAVTHFILYITLLVWVPTHSTFYVLFVVAGLWGLADAIWQTQINALYGQLFSSTPDAAFANYRMWESLGFAVTFAYSNYLCTHVKLYICMGVLAVGMVGYGVVEIRLRRECNFENKPRVKDAQLKTRDIE